MSQPQRTIQETIDMHTDDYASMLASLKPAARKRVLAALDAKERAEYMDRLYGKGTTTMSKTTTKNGITYRTMDAKWVVCPGVTNEGIRNHSMRDYCTTCAPWWEVLPVCPECSGRLKLSYRKYRCIDREVYDNRGELTVQKGCNIIAILGDAPQVRNLVTAVH